MCSPLGVFPKSLEQFWLDDVPDVTTTQVNDIELTLITNNR